MQSPLIPEETLASPLRVALVGAGRMGRHHLRAIARLSGLARVVAVADPAPDAAGAVAEIIEDARVFPSLSDLLRNEPVDVVHVCTAPASHEAVARQAIEAGCHIYVEKPFVERVAEAERVLSLAQERNRKVCAGHQLLFEGPTRRALDLMPALREIVHLESYFSFRPVRMSSDGRAAMPPDKQLLDILPHPVYLLLRFLEEAAPGGTTEILSVEAGPAGTVHVGVRRGGISSDLTVTLEGRPVESYMRLVGRNGTIHADYVRGTVQRLIGPGTSGVDKVLNPFRLSRQLTTGAIRSVGERLLRRQRSYPGLAEIFEAFYTSIREGGPSPTPVPSIIETVRFSERIEEALHTLREPTATSSSRVEAPTEGEPRVLVTGGTGFLGREVVRALRREGAHVSVLARREPVGWERIEGVEYRVADLGEPLRDGTLEGIDTIVHCAAETAGGWSAHRRNSIEATRNLLSAARTAAVRDVIHVSSIAVLAPPRDRAAVAEESPLHPDGKAAGPYVWGKLESERLARSMGEGAGPDVRIVRPPALVDFRRFDAPGKLGKTLGNLAVAVGGAGEELAVVDVCAAAETIAWMARNPDRGPDILNLLPATLPTRRELVAELRRTNPDLRVVWLPRLALHPLSWLASGAQKVLRPRNPPISVARVFALQRYDNTRAAELARMIEDDARRKEAAATSAAQAEDRAAEEAAQAGERAAEEAANTRTSDRRERDAPSPAEATATDP